MIGDLSKLTDVYDSQPVMVGMPNGQNSVASKRGRVKLSSTIILYDVLYVPGLTCNLISVAQLVNELFCTVTNKLCVIQDYSMRRPIGVGEQRSWVFFFRDNQSEKALVNQVITREVWHQRLGHPSDQVMSLLSGRIGSYNKEGSEVCDVCFRAKQTRSVFAIRDNQATNCDIWGAYRIESFTAAHYFLSIVDDASRGTWVYLMKEKKKAKPLS